MATSSVMNTRHSFADDVLWDGHTGFLSRSWSMTWDGHAGFLLRSQPNLPTLPPMTVCIGALCMNGTAVVMAADRQIALPAHNLKGSDGPDCKIATLSARRLLASAGAPPDPSLLSDFRAGLRDNHSVTEVLEVIYGTSSRFFQKWIGKALVEPIAGMSYESFIKATQNNSLQEYVARPIWNQIHQKKGESFYLLGLIGDDGAHLYAVAELEPPRSLDMPGFGAVGAGASLAYTVLYRNACVKEMRLVDAVYLVYEAKRMAENSNDVSKETDMAIILPGQDAQFLSREALAHLAEIYKSKAPPDLTDAEAESIQELLPPATPVP